MAKIDELLARVRDEKLRTQLAEAVSELRRKKNPREGWGPSRGESGSVAGKGGVSRRGVVPET